MKHLFLILLSILPFLTTAQNCYKRYQTFEESKLSKCYWSKIDHVASYDDEATFNHNLKAIDQCWAEQGITASPDTKVVIPDSIFFREFYYPGYWWEGSSWALSRLNLTLCQCLFFADYGVDDSSRDQIVARNAIVSRCFIERGLSIPRGALLDENAPIYD